MKKTIWSPEKTVMLVDLAGRGLSRREIAAHLAFGVRAVTTKLLAMHMYAPLNPESRRAGNQAWAVNFPRFENVTRTEARIIAKGVPPSGKPSRDHGYSLTGNAADMCAS